MRPITAADLMNPGMLTVRDDMTVRELAAFLVDHKISGAPVEDRDGRLVGVVSLVDIASATSDDDEDDEEEESPEPASFFARGFDARNGQGVDDLEDLDLDDEELTVADIMDPKLYTISGEATVPEVAATMLKGHVHRLLVTRDDKVVGILSTSDLLGLLVGE